jgi:hypothetical protein
MFGDNEKGMRAPGRVRERESQGPHCDIESNQKRGEDACEDVDRQIEGTTEDVNASGAGGFVSLGSR